jgi:hypothetical protein
MVELPILCSRAGNLFISTLSQNRRGERDTTDQRHLCPCISERGIAATKHGRELSAVSSWQSALADAQTRSF